MLIVGCVSVAEHTNILWDGLPARPWKGRARMPTPQDMYLTYTETAI